MKGLLKGLLVFSLFVHAAFSGTRITTNSFVRHDIGFSAAPMDFAVGTWNTSGDSMIAAVTLAFNLPSTNVAQKKLEVISIGANFETNAPVVYTEETATGPIAIGDIDGDGANDIVFGAWTNVVIRKNTSTAAAPSFDARTVVEAGATGTLQGLALADLDGDGKLDVIYAAAQMYALRNQSSAGAISFAAPVAIYTNSAKLQMGDIDGDGKVDLEVTPTPVFGMTAYLRNTSSPGTIQFVQTSVGSTRNFLIDVNSDAKLDHVSIVDFAISFPREEAPTALRFSTNSSSAGMISFAPGTTVEVDVPERDFPSRGRLTVPSFRPSVASGDFNQDGRIDLVWADWTNRIVFLENLNGMPRELRNWASGVEALTISYPFQPTVNDINNDGKLDLLIGSASRYVSIFENRIEPTPELVVAVEGATVVEVGDIVQLKATAYAASVSAVDFFEDGRSVGSATAENGFRAEYVATTAGLHKLTAQVTAGASAGLVSSAVGVRVVDGNLGGVVGFGDGVVSSTTILIYDSGRAFGVGSNARGQFGDIFYESPHAGFVEFPRQTNAGGWKAMSAGAAFTIGLTTDGKVFSWGANEIGQLGRVTAGTTNPSPGEVVFRTNVVIQKIGAGRDFVMALDADGDLFAWGANLYGQLGKGDITAREKPSKLAKPEGVARWRDVSVGLTHVLALDDAGQVFGWGWNYWGQAGVDRTNVAVLAPTRIELPAGETAWTNIHAGVVASYAQTASGRTYRWGDYMEDEGEVVDHVPRLLEAPEGSGGFKMVGAGAPLNVALAEDGNAYVWGGGILSPTGLGDQTTVTNPTRLPLPAGVTGWKTIAVAARRAAALADDGRVFVWGFDFGDALGTGTEGANVPTEPCMPLEGCDTNFPPAVKIVRPAFGDVYPADGVLRFEVAAEDFDGVVESVRVVMEEFSPREPVPEAREVARLGFGETSFEVPVPGPGLLPPRFLPIAYDNNGLVSTGASFRLTLPSFSTGTFLTLTNTAPPNELTGWREAFVSYRNNSSFRLGTVSAILSNLPAGVVIRNNAFPTAPGVERIVDRFGLGPGETATFRIEYKLAEDVSGAQILVRFGPGAANGIGPSQGEAQPVTMTILTNGFRLLEFDHALGQQHVVQFTDTLTNWTDAAGFMEEREGRMLWIDGGPPATSKHPAQAQSRFYRVLRKP